jgi:hypothetical protein
MENVKNGKYLCQFEPFVSVSAIMQQHVCVQYNIYIFYLSRFPSFCDDGERSMELLKR